MAASIIRLEGEQQVNTTTTNIQYQSSVTVLEDGGWVVTWASNDQGGSNFDVYQQRYNADGTAHGLEQKVNTTTSDIQQYPRVTALKGGGWIVTWTSNGQDGDHYGVYQQRYNADGSPSGTEQQVNTTATGNQSQSSVTAMPDGGWIVTWQHDALNGLDYSICQQRYNADGSIHGTEQFITPYRAAGVGRQTLPAIATLADGGWVVAWSSEGQDGSDWGIYQHRFLPSGVMSDLERVANTTTTGSQVRPSVTALKDGGWVVTWESYEQDGSGYGIYQQRYDADWTPRGTEQKVNTTTADSQFQSSVTTLADGGWVVTWASLNQDGSGYGIYQQRYDANGTAFGPEQQVNVTTANNQWRPSVVALPDGSWVVTWDSDGQDGSSNGIYQQRYHALTAFEAGVESGIGGASDDVFQARNGGFEAGDSLDGGAGTDTVRMIEGGTLDLTAPTLLTGVEIVQGSRGNDVIIANVARINDVYALSGGAGNDDLQLVAGDYDLTGKILSGFEAITLQGTGSLTFEDKTLALLARSLTKDGTLTLQDDVFTTAERLKLFSQGFMTLADADGTHVLKHGTDVGESVSGDMGHDVLFGGLGNDTLTGAAGQDVFVFDTKPNKSANVDAITDFVVADDSIWLDNAVFTKLGAGGSLASPLALKSGFFYTGSTAHDRDDRLIYNRATGVLYYDADGTGSAAKVKIATLPKNLKLTAHDFFVV